MRFYRSLLFLIWRCTLISPGLIDWKKRQFACQEVLNPSRTTFERMPGGPAPAAAALAHPRGRSESGVYSSNLRSAVVCTHAFKPSAAERRTSMQITAIEMGDVLQKTIVVRVIAQA